MRKKLFPALIVSVMLTGCGSEADISKKPQEVISKVHVQAQAKQRTQNTPHKNIIIVNDNNNDVSEKKATVDNGIMIDPGDSKVLETAIDRITEELER